MGGKDGHLGSPAKQLLGHGLRGVRSGQHGPALCIQEVHAARSPASPEGLRMLQQLCAATPVRNEMKSLEGHLAGSAHLMLEHCLRELEAALRESDLVS